MKVKIEIPKAAVTQYKRNAALDMAKEALSAQPRIDPQELLQAIYKHPLLGEYEKAVITGIVRELQEDESEVDG
jgi:hypothetical protein